VPEFLEKISLLGLDSIFNINKTEVVNTETKSDIIFREIKTSSGNQTANLKSLQGVSTWVYDECEEETSEDRFDTIDLSVRQKGIKNRIILILNPTTKEHWIYKRWFQSENVLGGSNMSLNDVTYIHTDYRDNKDNLSESFLQQIMTMKRKRPQKYKHQILGGWLNKAEGVIFNNWSISKCKKVSISVFGQEFRMNDPNKLIETNIDTTNKIIFKAISILVNVVTLRTVPFTAAISRLS